LRLGEGHAAALFAPLKYPSTTLRDAAPGPRAAAKTRVRRGDPRHRYNLNQYRIVQILYNIRREHRATFAVY
jgi:hypothetical protein